MMLRLRRNLADRLRRAAWRVDPDLRNRRTRPMRDGHYRRNAPNTVVVELSLDTSKFNEAMRNAATTLGSRR